MRLGVPGQGRHTVAEGDPHPLKQARHLARAITQIGIADTGVLLALAGGHDFGLRMPLRRMLDDLVER
ncbi:hypothetical protein D3C80_617450 [compost metagenome]